jgi:hypothetical protein
MLQRYIPNRCIGRGWTGHYDPLQNMSKRTVSIKDVMVPRKIAETREEWKSGRSGESSEASNRGPFGPDLSARDVLTPRFLLELRHDSRFANSELFCLSKAS